MTQIITEGWRFLPHSYAIVNQFQLLEMGQRSELELFHRDLPYYSEHWQHTTGIFTPKDEMFFADLPEPAPNQTAAAIYRISFPYDLQAHSTIPTFVFGTSEFGTVNNALKAKKPLPEQLDNSPTTIITPSRWSKQGFIRSGADPERVIVIPHGVDTSIFKPLEPYERNNLRTKLGWNQHFIFLHTGAMTGNKGINTILKSLAVIAANHPHVRLVLKGLNSLYQSQKFVNEILKTISEHEKELVLPRIIFSGNTFSFAEMAQLYQAADAYISPYIAEGFNMPVMEACACGLPVICTAGGPTDEFTSPEFTLRISSKPTQAIDRRQERVYFLTPDPDHTITLMRQIIEDQNLRERIQKLGPRFMDDNFTWKHIVDQLLRTILEPSSHIL